MIYTLKELTAINDLISTLNIAHAPSEDHQVGIEIDLHDVNGESLGRIKWQAGPNAYVLAVDD